MSDLTDRQQSILRSEAITGADNLEHPQGSWGELDEDYSQVEHHQSWGKGPHDSDFENYAEKYQPTDIKIK